MTFGHSSDTDASAPTPLPLPLRVPRREAWRSAGAGLVFFASAVGFGSLYSFDAKPEAGVAAEAVLAVPTNDGQTVVSIDRSDVAGWVAALQALPENERRRIEKVLAENAQAGLGWITVVDTMDPDGDTVRISSLGVSQDVVLTTTPMRVAVPFVHGGEVEIIGLRDGGGGGITVGIVTSQGTLPLPFMDVDRIVRVRTP